MPRDSSGNYTLPDGNPVVSGTVITSRWANVTMSDIAYVLTNSLDRNGNGAMLAPLTLAAGVPTDPLHATSKDYVDSSVIGYLPLAGGTLTGPLILDADPAVALEAATKQYVDSNASAPGISEAPIDGNQYARQNAAWAQVSIPTGLGSMAYNEFVVNDVAPTTPDIGDRWVRPADGQEYIRVPTVDGIGAWLNSNAGEPGPIGPAGPTGPPGPAGPSSPPGGADTQVQFNDAGAFAGDADLTWDKTANTLTVGSVATPGIIKGAAGSSSAGGALSITSGAGSGASNPGGALSLSTGTPGGASANAGAITIICGDSPGTSPPSVFISGSKYTGASNIAGGPVNLVGGNGGSGATPTAGVGGQVSLQGGAGWNGGQATILAGQGNNGPGGDAVLTGGLSSAGGNGGAVSITGGQAQATGFTGGAVTISGGAATSGNGGAVSLKGRNGVGTNRNGGNVLVQPGTATGSGTPGNIQLDGGNGAALATTAVGGFVTIPTCAGTPTGVPVNVPTGSVPLVYDSTNKKLFTYSGSWLTGDPTKLPLAGGTLTGVTLTQSEYQVKQPSATYTSVIAQYVPDNRFTIARDNTDWGKGSVQIFLNMIELSTYVSAANATLRFQPSPDGVGLSLQGAATTAAAASVAAVWEGDRHSYRVCTSARRFKKEFQPLPDGALALVAALKPLTYLSAIEGDAPGRMPGFVAEDFAELGLTEYVTYQDGEVFNLKYDRITVLLVKAIQELLNSAWN